MSVKVIISDVNADHANKVKAALLAGASGSLLSEEIEVRYGGFSVDIYYARDIGATMVVRSTTGASSVAMVAGEYYRAHGIQIFMPAGSNTEGLEIYESNDGINLPVIVLTGAGDLDNETADDIEFFAPDPVTIEPDYSSFGNGYVAGQLWKIKSDLQCSWWEARFRARVTGSKNNVWHEQDGFGLIDVNAAEAYGGTIDDDPFITLGVVGELSVVQAASQITLTAEPVSNSTGIVFEKNTGSGWQVVQNNVWHNVTLYLDANIETQFRYKAINEAVETDYSNIVTATWIVPPPPDPEPDPLEGSRWPGLRPRRARNSARSYRQRYIKLKRV